MRPNLYGGPGSGPERTPGYLEREPEDGEAKKPKQERRGFKWLFEKEPDQEEQPQESTEKPRTEKLKTTEAKEAVQKTDPNIDPSSPEFKELSNAQKKYVLAKREVRQKTTELEEELAEIEPTSDEAAQVMADLALVRAVDQKLDNPEQEFAEQVEQTYAMIMESLDEILAEPEVIEEVEETEEEVLELPREKPRQPEGQPKTKTKREPIFKTMSKKPAPEGSDTATITPDSTSYDGGPSTPSVESTPPAPAATRGEAAPSTSTEEVRQRRAGSLAVSEALTVMLAKRYEDNSTPNETTDVRKDIQSTLHQHEQAVRGAAAEYTASKARESTQGETTRRPHVMEYAHAFEEPPVAVEPIRLDTHESHEQAAPRQLKPETQRNLRDASTEELLQIGSHIKVDGYSLRDLYNRNEIDRKGLTKIVTEALKGGDVKRAYKKARLSAEAQLGRKIETRHDDPKALPFTDVATVGVEHSARSNQLLEALHAVQKTAKQTTEAGGANIPSKEDVQQAVMQQRRAAALSIAAVTAVVVIASALLFIFIF